MGRLWRGPIGGWVEAERILRCSAILFVLAATATLGAIEAFAYFYLGSAGYSIRSYIQITLECAIILGPPVWMFLSKGKVVAFVVLLFSVLIAGLIDTWAAWSLRLFSLYAFTHWDDLVFLTTVEGITVIALAILWTLTAVLSWRSFQAALALSRLKPEDVRAG